MAAVIHVLNGPNLNLLGEREPDVYGDETLHDIETMLDRLAADHGASITFHQTNSEGVLVDQVQAARHADGLILNAGAYTHTSVALHDALRAVHCPVIEVHLSNPAAREDFRKVNFLAPAVTGTIAGLRAHGYALAFEALMRLYNDKETQ